MASGTATANRATATASAAPRRRFAECSGNIGEDAFCVDATESDVSLPMLGVFDADAGGAAVVRISTVEEADAPAVGVANGRGTGVALALSGSTKVTSGFD